MVQGSIPLHFWGRAVTKGAIKVSLSVEGTSIEAYGPRTLATAVVKQQGCTGHIPAKQQPSLAAAGRK